MHRNHIKLNTPRHVEHAVTDIRLRVTNTRQVLLFLLVVRAEIHTMIFISLMSVQVKIGLPSSGKNLEVRASADILF